ncbi:hypothetical protein BDW75DRAFT_97523 [Aspergillus navahoensis]
MSSLFLSTAPGTTLHIRVSRPSTPIGKPLIVFLHYWGGSSSTWYKLTSTDSQTSIANKYPTAAVDLRGWGKSTGPVYDPGSAYSVTAMAADTASVLSRLETDADYNDFLAHGFILVGHSMGAKVALATLSVLPAHLLERLKGLVLVAPAPPTALELPGEMKEQQRAAYETQSSVRWTVENILARVDRLSQKDLECLVHDSLAGNDLSKAAWPLYGMREDISNLVSKTIRGKGIRVRILAGELDVVEPQERVQVEVCQYLKELGANVSFRIVEGVKHLIPLEMPQAVRDEISIF